VSRLIVVCKNPACPDSGSTPMTCRQEYFAAWLFECPTCGARRVVTKDQIGGVPGAGVDETKGRYVRGAEVS
jgi:hypothetical protein